MRQLPAFRDIAAPGVSDSCQAEPTQAKEQGPPGTTVTELLRTADPHDAAIVDRLLPLVYHEMRTIARRQMAREREGHTLTATALVHEAYVKLVDQTQVPVGGRAHFFGAAARAMRQILVDHARQRLRAKRGGNVQPVPLEEWHGSVEAFGTRILDVHDALERLADVDPRAARVVECRFFGGLSVDETARALGVTSRTVKRDWVAARAWLARALVISPEP